MPQLLGQPGQPYELQVKARDCVLETVGGAHRQTPQFDLWPPSHHPHVHTHTQICLHSCSHTNIPLFALLPINLGAAHCIGFLSVSVIKNHDQKQFMKESAPFGLQLVPLESVISGKARPQVAGEEGGWSHLISTPRSRGWSCKAVQLKPVPVAPFLRQGCTP